MLKFQLPATLGSTISDRWYGMEIAPPGMRIMDASMPDNGFALRDLGLRVQSGVEPASSLVDGRWPELVVDDLELAPVEVALSQRVADGLNATVGSTFAIRVRDGADTLRMAVVGVFRPTDPGAAIWAEEPELLEPFAPIGQDGVPWRGVAVVNVAAIDPLITRGYSAEVTWRYRVDAAQLTTARLDEFTAAVLTAPYPSDPCVAGVDSRKERLILGRLPRRYSRPRGGSGVEEQVDEQDSERR